MKSQGLTKTNKEMIKIMFEVDKEMIKIMFEVDMVNGLFGSVTARVKFELGHLQVKWHFGSLRFGSSMVRLKSISGQLIFYQICSPCETSNFVENFGLGMVWFEAIRVSGLLLSEHILVMNLSRSVRILSFGSILRGLIRSMLFWL